MMEKTLKEYAQYVMYKVWKGEHPLNVTPYLIERLKKERLEKFIRENTLPKHIRELFIQERWRKSETIYRHVRRSIRDPVLAHYLYELRSALEEWYILNGWVVKKDKMDLSIGKDGRTYKAVITPKKEILFFGQRAPSLIPPDFTPYVQSPSGNEFFFVYQKEVVSALIPYIFQVESYEVYQITAELLR